MLEHREGLRGLETFPEEGFELGLERRQLLCPAMAIRDPGPQQLVSSHIQLDCRHLRGSTFPDPGR